MFYLLFYLLQMKIIKNILDLNKAIKNFKDFGFVPTMGGIHDGHISLIKNSQKNCKKTIVSIFVNPTQFNNKIDFKKYPRNIVKDIKILKKCKIEYLFIPNTNEIYSSKRKRIKIDKKDKVMCAKHRKGHFEGVLEVMSKLLNLITAKSVFMGEKDYQQLFLIRKYLSKKYRTKIIGCPIIRDKNKVALSTRNKLLNKKNYYNVSKISKFLLKTKKNFKFNSKKLSFSLIKIKKDLEKEYQIKIDYLECRNSKNLKISNLKTNYKLFIAYHINNVRLIDNF